MKIYRKIRPYKPLPGVRARSKTRVPMNKSIVVRPKSSLKDKVFTRLRESVDSSKLRSTLKDQMTCEFDRIIDQSAAKVAEFLPFATAAAAKIMMKRVQSTVSQSMFGEGGAGVRELSSGRVEGYIAGKRVNNYAWHWNFSGPRTKRLAHLVTQNATTKLQVAPIAQEEGDAGKQFFQTGFNQKGVMRWQSVPNSPNTDWSTPATSVTVYPLSWSVIDDERILKADPGLVSWADATSVFAGSDQTIEYPIVSRHIDFQVFNSNAFMPCSVKVYLCKRKKGTGTYGTPMNDWFRNPALAQAQGVMDTQWSYAWQTTPASNIFAQSNPNDWFKETPINLNAYPALSSNFNQRWEIVDVRKQRLDALESLNCSIEVQATEMFSIRNVIQQKQNQLDPVTTESWPYALMIEFQGQNGLVVPRVDDGTGAATDGSPVLVDSMPTKVRFKYRKYARVAFGSVDTSNQRSMYTKQFTTSGGQTVSVPLGPMAGVLSENTSQSLPVRYTSTYSRLSDESGSIGSYYIPVYTDQAKQTAQPLADQQ